MRAGAPTVLQNRWGTYSTVAVRAGPVSAAAFAALSLPADGNSKTVYAVISAGYAVTAFTYGRVNRRRRTDETPASETGPTRTATVE